MNSGVKPEDYRVRIETEGRWKLRLTSYKLGNKYICTADNVDPGANLVKAEGQTREEAESAALQEARVRIRSTRTFQ